jgi:hypothetical protein
MTSGWTAGFYVKKSYAVIPMQCQTDVAWLARCAQGRSQQQMGLRKRTKRVAWQWPIVLHDGKGGFPSWTEEDS